MKAQAGPTSTLNTHLTLNIFMTCEFFSLKKSEIIMVYSFSDRIYREGRKYNWNCKIEEKKL